VADELRAYRARQGEDLLRLGVRLSEDSFVVAKADGSPYQPRSLTHPFTQWIPLKSLGHSHATEMLSSNIHPKVVQQRLGHSTISVTLDITATFWKASRMTPRASLTRPYGRL
jgi:integrase